MQAKPVCTSSRSYPCTELKPGNNFKMPPVYQNTELLRGAYSKIVIALFLSSLPAYETFPPFCIPLLKHWLPLSVFHCKNTGLRRLKQYFLCISSSYKKSQLTLCTIHLNVPEPVCSNRYFGRPIKRILTSKYSFILYKAKLWQGLHISQYKGFGISTCSVHI